MAKVIRLIYEVLHILSHFRPIKELLLINSIMVSVFKMANVFRSLCEVTKVAVGCFDESQSILPATSVR
jgi:hypothetical protein